MKKTTLIDIAAFIIPAIIAFISYSHGDTLDKIGYAIAIGLTWCLGCSWITSVFLDEEFIQTAPVSEKTSQIVGIIAYVIAYWYFYKKAYLFGIDGKVGRAWAIFITTMITAGIVTLIVKYIVKVFEK